MHKVTGDNIKSDWEVVSDLLLSLELDIKQGRNVYDEKVEVYQETSFDTVQRIGRLLRQQMKKRSIKS